MIRNVSQRLLLPQMLALLLTLSIAVSACSTNSGRLTVTEAIPKPVTNSERLAFAEATFTSVVEGLTKYKDQMNESTLKTLKTTVRAIDVALDSAHVYLQLGDKPGFEGKLKFVNDAVEILTHVLEGLE